MRMRVIVTQQDWLDGNPGQSNSCPIALAIQHMFQNWNWNIRISSDRWSLWQFRNNKSFCGNLTPAAKAYVKAFDDPKERDTLCVPITDLVEFVADDPNDKLPGFTAVPNKT